MQDHSATDNTLGCSSADLRGSLELAYVSMQDHSVVHVGAGRRRPAGPGPRSACAQDAAGENRTAGRVDRREASWAAKPGGRGDGWPPIAR